MPASGADNASIRSRAYTARGPDFNLDIFSSKDFIVKDFVESLSDSAVPAGRRSQPASAQAAFDPKPLIRAFESALSRLSALSNDLSAREADLSGSVHQAERQHNQNVASLSSKLSQAIDSFNRLDSSLNGSANGDAGGSAALRLGERLEELDRQSQRAQDAKFLIQCWIEVNDRGNLSLLEDMRRMGGAEGKVRSASIARQLLKLSQRLDPAASHNGANSNGVNGNGTKKNNAREVIEKFLEELEQDLLNSFDDFYRRQNFEGMRECAAALHDFNEGASVMGLFVNQHQFFIDRSNLVTEEVTGDGETWDKLADPDAEPPGVEPTLQSLVDEVKLVAQDESFIMKQAFSFHEEVLQRFLQRVFQQSIQQRLELVLEKADSISSLAFLRSLQASRSYIGSMVDDLKAHGLTEHPEPASTQIAATLDQQLDELFMPYFTRSTYIEREKKNLEELYTSLLYKFTLYHSRRRKMATGYLAKIRQQAGEVYAGYMDRLASSDMTASQKAMLMKIAGMSADTEKKESDIEVTEADGQLSLPTAKRMLKWLAEGVGRGLELNGGNETPKDVQALLGLLLTHMGEIYLETALDAISDHTASQENPRTEPEVSYLSSLHNAISILHLLSTSITTILLPLASSNLTIRRDIEKTSQHTISTLESRISLILNRTVDTALVWVGRLLSQQKKTDFRPREEDFERAVEMLQTPVCLSVYTFLSKLSQLAASALDGQNLTLFLSDLAIGLRFALLEHFRKFTISLTGGLLVSKDVTKYVELVRPWPLAESEFEKSGGLGVVSEVANLFVIGPEALRERLKSAKPEEREELRRFVECREDRGSVGVLAVLSAV